MTFENVETCKTVKCRAECVGARISGVAILGVCMESWLQRASRPDANEAHINLRIALITPPVDYFNSVPSFAPEGSPHFDMLRARHFPPDAP